MKTTQRVGKVMVHVEVTTEPAVIQFQDILNACRIEPDYDYDAFDCDGLEHENQEITYGFCGLPDASERRGYYSSRDGSGVITIDRNHARREMWGAGYRCSKQVQAEMIAQEIGTTIDYIKTWYDGTGEAYGVVCEYAGEEDSCWGYDSYEFAQSQCQEHALNVAHQLEDAGYTIEGKPDRRAEYLKNRRETLKYKLSLDCWKEYKRGNRSYRRHMNRINSERNARRLAA